MIPIGESPTQDGRYVVVFPAGATQYGQSLRQVMGVREVRSAAEALTEGPGSGAVVFDRLGIAVVQADPDQLGSLRSADRDTLLSVEPELVHRPLGAGSPDYLAGYRDGVDDLSRRLGLAQAQSSSTASFTDDDSTTWGVQALGVAEESSGAAGIKVAVLDTGFTRDHPDFVDRGVRAQSFVEGEDAGDAHGHGTHCVGTACGPRQPASGVRRYGVAYAAQTFSGKVLGNDGTGSDMSILAGIDWALGEGCQVISMSLGTDERNVSAAYERAGSAALTAGSLIIAAAGNNAQRPGDPGFVGVPANSPSIMAVGALDQQLATASFSAGSTTVPGGQIDIAAPGVDVFSSWVLPELHQSISGTSMATPHVAGLAAIYAQQTGLRGRDLWTQLTQTAQRLQQPSADVGSGLARLSGL